MNLIVFYFSGGDGGFYSQYLTSTVYLTNKPNYVHVVSQVNYDLTNACGSATCNLNSESYRYFLSGDYVNYEIWYSCSINANGVKVESAYVRTRTRDISDVLFNNIVNIIAIVSPFNKRNLLNFDHQRLKIEVRSELFHAYLYFTFYFLRTRYSE